MPSLPVGKNHDPRPLLAEDACNLQAVLPGVLNPGVGDIERRPPACFKNPGRSGGLARAVFGRATRTHFTLREIEDAGATSGLGHFQQGSAASLLHVVAMRGNGQDVESERSGHFFRSTRKWASVFSMSARLPKESSAEQPEATSMSACLMEASNPNSAG